MKKILITGAAGMLGSDLVDALSGSFEILGAGLTPAPHLTIPYAQFDLSDAAITSDTVQRFRPELIFHCAALTDVDAYELRAEELLRLNERLISAIVTAANQTGALLIFFSTDYVFDGKKQGAYLESDTLCPASVYGKSKADAETYIRQNAKHFAIFRISWLFGKHGKSFPRTIWEKAVSQPHFKVVADQVGRPTFTKDLAGAFKQLLTQSQSPLPKIDGQTFHLSNHGKTSWADLAAFILKVQGSPAAVEKISSAELNRPAPRPANSVLDLEKAERVLGLRLRPWEPAITEFLRDLKGE